MNDVTTESVASEMQSVKMFLILQAMALGRKPKHIAAVLDVSDAALSHMFTKAFVKEIARAALRRNVAEVEES
jgi:hypothetical protein